MLWFLVLTLCFKNRDIWCGNSRSLDKEPHFHRLDISVFWTLFSVLLKRGHSSSNSLSSLILSTIRFGELDSICPRTRGHQGCGGPDGAGEGGGTRDVIWKGQREFSLSLQPCLAKRARVPSFRAGGLSALPWKISLALNHSVLPHHVHAAILKNASSPLPLLLPILGQRWPYHRLILMHLVWPGGCVLWSLSHPPHKKRNIKGFPIKNPDFQFICNTPIWESGPATHRAQVTSCAAISCHSWPLSSFSFHPEWILDPDWRASYLLGRWAQNTRAGGGEVGQGGKKAVKFLFWAARV